MPRRRIYEKEIMRLVKSAKEKRLLLDGARTPEEREGACLHLVDWLTELEMAVFRDAIATELYGGLRQDGGDT